VTIVTDHHGTGTNVLALPTGLDFHFSYGANSASLHRREAERLGCPVTTVSDSPWRFDVDEPDDLDD
jgi:2-phospho-L-lactate guanylyltransferase